MSAQRRLRKIKLFNPLTGQFEHRRVAALDPVVYNELKQGTAEVSEEASFLREHASKNKQHLREIKARLRKLETASSPSIDVAMELDLINSRIDAIEALVQNPANVAVVDTSKIEAQIAELQNRKPANLVSVQIDERIENSIMDLAMAIRAMEEMHSMTKEHQKSELERLEKKLKLSIWLSAISTAIVIALKLLL